MLWKKNIVVPEQTHQELGSALYVCRIFGLFPIKISKEENNIYWTWSPFYALYSVFLAVSLAVLNYRGMLEDVLCERKESVRIKADVDVYVVFADLSAVQLTMICGVFVSVFKNSNFFKIIKCLGEIDVIKLLNDTKPLRKTSPCTVFVLLLITVSMSTADVLMYLKAEEGSIESKAIKRYFTVYITYCVVLMSQYKFWHLGSAISRRLKYLNENLDSLNKKDAAIQLLSPNYILYNITTAYLKLYEVTKLLNQFLEVINTVTILEILWHFVEAPYHLLSEINGPKKDAAVILTMVGWVCFHIGRLLILIEPCNSCKLEVQKMKSSTCRLLYSNKMSAECKLQLQVFSSVLGQCELQFSAAGFKKIDRSLITAVIGAVGTYLVILIQFQKTNT